MRFGPGRSLVGVLTHPPESDDSRHQPAFILSNAGIVHRVGPHRLYVKLARRLSALGHPVLRFDFSGIGDSHTREDLLPFDESSVKEQQDAMSCVQDRLGVSRFVVGGLCSGAKVAFATACCDARVVGAVPINAGLHLHPGATPAALVELRRRSQARHYWRMAFFSSFRGKNWKKALGRQLDVGARLKVMLRTLGSPVRSARSPEQGESVLHSLEERGVRVLHVYAEGDECLDYFNMVLGKQAKRWPYDGPIRLEVIRGADHTFTLLWSQERLMELICSWAQQQVWSS